jgi:hypothetical protein
MQALSAANAGKDRIRALRRAIRVFMGYLSMVLLLSNRIISEAGMGPIAVIGQERKFRLVTMTVSSSA